MLFREVACGTCVTSWGWLWKGCCTIRGKGGGTGAGKGTKVSEGRVWDWESGVEAAGNPPTQPRHPPALTLAAACSSQRGRWGARAGRAGAGEQEAHHQRGGRYTHIHTYNTPALDRNRRSPALQGSQVLTLVGGMVVGGGRWDVGLRWHDNPDWCCYALACVALKE